MRDVAIIGAGMLPVGEHWQSSIRMLGSDALRLAFEDARITSVDALYVGNAYGPTYSSQSNIAALVADHSRLVGVEAFSVDAGDASGGAALRAGYLAVASGLVDTVAVLGVEKSTDSIGGMRVESRSVSLDADYESIHGATLPALGALLMQRYMFEHKLDLSVFEGFSINAHRNGKVNPYAMFRNTIREGSFAKAPMVSSPVNLFDSAPDADGAAAVILTASEFAADMSPNPIRIAGSAAATDTFALQDRKEFLYFSAVAQSIQKATAQAGLSVSDFDLFELHDVFTIVTALTLEAAGLAEAGQGWEYATNAGSRIALDGDLPISTFGGLKSRGNPAGATGIYQAVEAVLQLRGKAGANQVADANTACIQNLAGLGSTAITHILTRMS